MQVVNEISSEEEPKSDIIIVRIEPSKKAKVLKYTRSDYGISDMVRDGLELMLYKFENEGKKAS